MPTETIVARMVLMMMMMTTTMGIGHEGERRQCRRVRCQRQRHRNRRSWSVLGTNGFEWDATEKKDKRKFAANKSTKKKRRHPKWREKRPNELCALLLCGKCKMLFQLKYLNILFLSMAMSDLSHTNICAPPTHCNIVSPMLFRPKYRARSDTKTHVAHDATPFILLVRMLKKKYQIIIFENEKSHVRHVACLIY